VGEVAAIGDAMSVSTNSVPGNHPCRQAVLAGSRGFTLTELMIAITVLAILSAFALPSMTEFVRGQRVKTATSDVYASLILARSEAIKRAANVNIVPNGTDWALGWRITNSGGTNLKVQNAIEGVVISGLAGTLTFRRDGRLTGAVPDFVLSSPDSAAVTARCVRLDPSGKPNIKVDTNSVPADGCQ